MLWELRQSERNPVDKYGLGALLKRMEDEAAGTGERLQGFTFLEDARRMLAYTRQIESAVLEAGGPGPLYVGFQNAMKLELETKRYLRMRDRGVVIYAYGEGTPTADALKAVHWCRLDAHHARLENQWFLVTKSPEPLAFVGWEVSPDAIWGEGGVSREGKQFTGFISNDERVADAIIRHLDTVRAGSAGVMEQEDRGTTSALIERMRPRRALAVVDDGHRPELTRTLSRAIDGCVRSGAKLYLYDLASASYLTSPYPEEYEEAWRHPLGPTMLRDLGRGYVADLVEKAQQRGIDASGILPYGVGFGHLAKWCREHAIDLVVLPVEFTHPSLFQRLQGFTFESLLAGAKINVVIDDATQGSHVATAVNPASALAIS